MTRPDPAWRQRLRAHAERLRDAALEPLAERLGYARDLRHRQRWRREGSLLSIRGAKFFDHACGHGGGGAIDLVMHARGCGFREAVEFLAGTPPAAPAAAAPAGVPPVLRLPGPVPAHWPPVRDFLVRARSLDPALLERCRRAGTLYADRRRNAVFACRDRSGTPAGAELVGTRPLPDGATFKGLAPGSRRDRGGFWLTIGSAPPAAVLLTESAVDALSAVLLPVPGLPPDLLVAFHRRHGPPPASLARLLPRSPAGCAATTPILPATRLPAPCSACIPACAACAPQAPRIGTICCAAPLPARPNPTSPAPTRSSRTASSNSSAPCSTTHPHDSPAKTLAQPHCLPPTANH